MFNVRVIMLLDMWAIIKQQNWFNRGIRVSSVRDSERQTKLPWEMRQFKVTFPFGKRTHPVRHSEECLLDFFYHLNNSSESGSCTSSILIYFWNWCLHQCIFINHMIFFYWHTEYYLCSFTLLTQWLVCGGTQHGRGHQDPGGELQAAK